MPGSSGLGWASCLMPGPGDGGLAPVASHTSTSSLFPHTLTDPLLGQALGWALGGHKGGDMSLHSEE